MAAVALIPSGCAYFNALYNAERAYRDAEAARWRGQPSVAGSLYDRAIQGAARSYRSDREGRWADNALFLMGRAHARRGDWDRSAGAMEEVLAVSRDDRIRSGAMAWLAAARLEQGDPAEALRLLDQALPGITNGESRGEALLWRARAQLRLGHLQEGWRDLDAAGAEGRRAGVQAELDRLVYGVATGEREQAARGGQALLSMRDSRGWEDSIGRTVERARRGWGDGAALELLQGAESVPWTAGGRGRLLLARAGMKAASGDLPGAEEDAWVVASLEGRLGELARVQLARWRLQQAAELEGLEQVRGLLLPAIALPEALELTEAMRTLVVLVERSGTRNQPHALFAAAEMARDRLGAAPLARSLFLAYATSDRGSAWEGKALLAALALGPDGEERAEVEARLAGLEENLYVRASRFQAVPDQEYQILERRLATVLETVTNQAVAEARQREVQVGEAGRALDSVRAAEDRARRLAAGDRALLDSLRADSLRADSLRADSLRRDSVPWDTLPGANPTPPPVPDPVLRRLSGEGGEGRD